MRRLKDEADGAIAVMTALLMVLVLGMTALVVDVGMLYFERAQLQNGADAGALAIAQECAYQDLCDPTLAASTATTLASANANDSRAAATVDLSATNTVVVTTSTITSTGEPAVQHWFAPILGIDSTEVGASATASWGSPSKATVFPFTAPKCLFDQTPSDVEIWITVTSNCTGSDGKSLPGAFGWLDTLDKKSCTASVDVDEIIAGDPGKSGPQNCDIDGKTIMLPVYVEKSGNGSKVEYIIDGFAAFYVTKHSWPSESINETGCNNCAGIKGKFITLVSLEDLESFGVEELGGDELNAFFVTLSK
ncbi:Tad domain-containing protein [Arthrobacter sp. CAL618]|uniref:Tad domain-containing protein n=1 Tax=Arthrobacter sp. CAL618 TaxID=1055770 RepID=UPI000414AE52|nr:Tad domain-containing protein [Arthrobacter sp. CAL618]